MAAVTAGVPMICTPMGRDQHAVAACVAQRDLGTVVSATASTEELRAAIAAALADGALQERARAFARRLDLPDGLRRAVDVLEGLGPGEDDRARAATHV
jgi:UDP:flavonoid glycosyltransferase YjiC (YdhE family)